MSATHSRPLFEAAIVRPALLDALKKLDPRRMVKNPVMFVVEVGSAFTTLLFLHAALTGSGDAPAGFILAVALWLWFTVLFANFAEAMAEGRGKAQAATLRKARQHVVARRVKRGHAEAVHLSEASRRAEALDEVPSSSLRVGDVVFVAAGELLPADGEVIEGVASVDESAITGESAPVIRESGGDRSAVTGGTRVLSDWLVVRVTTNPGETFLDRMIAMVEGAKRKKTPNEIALDILLAALTLVFLLATATLLPYARYAVTSAGVGSPVPLTILVSLLVCLIPTTIGGLLSAIGIAGMDRMIQANVIATSGRAVEAAGDVDVLLLDKTGTITLGNRQAHAAGVQAPRVARAQRRQGADASPAPERRLGPGAHRRHALAARLHGEPPQEAGARPGCPEIPPDRARRRLPLAGVACARGARLVWSCAMRSVLVIIAVCGVAACRAPSPLEKQAPFDFDAAPGSAAQRSY